MSKRAKTTARSLLSLRLMSLCRQWQMRSQFYQPRFLPLLLLQPAHQLQSQPLLVVTHTAPMEPPDVYQQWLQSLAAMSETEAAEALRKAFLKGTRADGLSFMRAEIFHHYEQNY